MGKAVASIWANFTSKVDNRTSSFDGQFFSGVPLCGQTDQYFCNVTMPVFCLKQWLKASPLDISTIGKSVEAFSVYYKAKMHLPVNLGRTHSHDFLIF